MNIRSRSGVLAAALCVAGAAAHAQFQEIKPAPYSTAVARQKIRALLANTDAGNHDRTVATISDWLKWYRDIVDEELIARWKTDGRTNIPLVMGPLADARVAREVLDFSWRVDRAETFTLAYAPMLRDLMGRYPERAKPMLDELLQPIASGPKLGPDPPEAEAVCRIFLDLPDTGTWRSSTPKILSRYRATADRILKQDLDGPDEEASYRASRWRAALRLDTPVTSSQRQVLRTNPASGTGQAVSNGYSQRPHLIGPQATGPLSSPAGVYTGPMSGLLESNGEPIPPNGECVFPNVPQTKLVLDFDTKHWEARLAPGEGHSQVLVLRNKGKGAQKKCVVRWTVVP